MKSDIDDGQGEAWQSLRFQYGRLFNIAVEQLRRRLAAGAASADHSGHQPGQGSLVCCEISQGNIGAEWKKNARFQEGGKRPIRNMSFLDRL